MKYLFMRLLEWQTNYFKQQKVLLLTIAFSKATELKKLEDKLKKEEEQKSRKHDKSQTFKKENI